MKTKISFALFFIAAAALSIALSGCSDEYDFGFDAILMTGTESDPLVSVAIDDVVANGYYITVSSTAKAEESVRVRLAIDNSKVDDYNAMYGTSFRAYPAGDVVLEDDEVVIEPGKSLSTATSIRVITDANLEEGPTYIVPITITSVAGGGFRKLESAGTIYIRLTKTINFNSLDMNASSMYACYLFPDEKMKMLTNFTFEVKVLVESFTFNSHRLRRIANFSTKDEDVNMIRYGEDRTTYNRLQWVSPGGSIYANDLASENTWHHISLTYDGSYYRMYFDGKLQNSTDGDLPIAFQMIEIGMSWENHQSSQRVNGRLAEMRVWDRALGAREIGFGNCAVDPETRGLVAYWRFNEGSGYIFHDETGNGYDMDWSDVWREIVDGAGWVHLDYSGNVRWNSADAVNMCN